LTQLLSKYGLRIAIPKGKQHRMMDEVQNEAVKQF
jgi:hypothetical protein